MEAEPVPLPLQPAGEEVFRESQCVTLGGSGLNTCCGHFMYFLSSTIRTARPRSLTGVIFLITCECPPCYPGIADKSVQLLQNLHQSGISSILVQERKSY